MPGASFSEFHRQAEESGRQSDAKAKAAGAKDRAEVSRIRAKNHALRVYSIGGHTIMEHASELANPPSDSFDI